MRETSIDGKPHRRDNKKKAESRRMQSRKKKTSKLNAKRKQGRNLAEDLSVLTDLSVGQSLQEYESQRIAELVQQRLDHHWC